MNPRKIPFKLINIIGIDGAGKTTLATTLARKMAGADPRVRYVYAQYFAKLLWPFKQAARLLFMTGTDAFREYNQYNERKQGASRAHPRLAMLYAALWVSDYLIQVFFKVGLALILGRRLVLDRYVYDISVNLSLTLGRESEFAVRLARLLLVFCRRPDAVVLIDLPEEVAWGRKNDIQGMAYLTQRRNRYLYLADAFGFLVIDGTGSPGQVLDRAVAALEANHAQEGPGRARIAVQESGPESRLDTPPDTRETILYVHANNVDVGGADFCLFKLAAALDKKRFRPVVCLARKTAVTELYARAGIKTWILPMTRIQNRRNPFYLLGLAWGFWKTVGLLRWIIRKEKAVLVHGNDLLDIYGPVAARLEGIPSVQYVRWIMVSPVWLRRIITALVYRLNTRVMTVSKAVARQMFAPKGKVLPGVEVCYDWLDREAVGHAGTSGSLRQELGLAEDAPVVGCVGRLEDWKGQDIFIRAAALVARHRPEVRFLVVGGDVQGRGREAFGTHCRSLAAALDLEGKMIFTGHRKDMGRVMSSLDILVHASRTPDPLPGVVMEAMAAGIPVVGANAGGVPEEMKAGETGLLYEPGNAFAMADALAALLDHPHRADLMGRAGKAHVHEQFSQTRHLNKIQRLYREMTGSEDAHSRYTYPCAPAGAAQKGETHVTHI